MRYHLHSGVGVRGSHKGWGKVLGPVAVSGMLFPHWREGAGAGARDRAGWQGLQPSVQGHRQPPRWGRVRTGQSTPHFSLPRDLRLYFLLGKPSQEAEGWEPASEVPKVSFGDAEAGGERRRERVWGSRGRWSSSRRTCRPSSESTPARGAQTPRSGGSGSPGKATLLESHSGDASLARAEGARAQG